MTTEERMEKRGEEGEGLPLSEETQMFGAKIKARLAEGLITPEEALKEVERAKEEGIVHYLPDADGKRRMRSDPKAFIKELNQILKHARKVASIKPAKGSAARRAKELANQQVTPEAPAQVIRVVREIVRRIRMKDPRNLLIIGLAVLCIVLAVVRWPHSERYSWRVPHPTLVYILDHDKGEIHALTGPDFTKRHTAKISR